jgi:hypothetical protein
MQDTTPQRSLAAEFAIGASSRGRPLASKATCIRTSMRSPRRRGNLHRELRWPAGRATDVRAPDDEAADHRGGSRRLEPVVALNPRPRVSRFLARSFMLNRRSNPGSVALPLSRRGAFR